MEDIVLYSDDLREKLQELTDIPELHLGEFIDANTGEIKGSTQALLDYIDAWRDYRQLQVAQEAHAEKGEALETSEAELRAAEGRLINAKNTLEAYKQILGDNTLQQIESKLSNPMNDVVNENDPLYDQIRKYTEYKTAVITATQAVEKLRGAYDEAAGDYEIEAAGLETYAEAVNAATEAITGLTEAQTEQAQTSLDGLAETLKTMSDYYKDLRENVMSNVSKQIGVFSADGIITEADKAKKEIQDLKSQITETNGKEINLKITGLEEQVPTAQNMAKALEDQVAYMERYEAAVAKARENNVRDEIIAQLSTGSTEDLDYLAYYRNDFGCFFDLDDVFGFVIHRTSPSGNDRRRAGTP